MSKFDTASASMAVATFLTDLGLGTLLRRSEYHPIMYQLTDSAGYAVAMELRFPYTPVGGVEKLREPLWDLADKIIASPIVQQEISAITQDLRDKQQEVADLQAQVAELENYRIHYEMERGIIET